MGHDHNDLHGIIDYLRVQGGRITQPRKDVIAILCDRSEPVTVKDLQAALPNINIVTLYRILDYLKQFSVVKELTHNPKEKFFELADPYHGHHHHAICRKCNKVFDIHCELKVPPIRGFVQESHVVTVYGSCETCPEPSAEE